MGEAVDLLGAHSDAKVLAGGHSLLPLMKLRLASPSVLVDINRIPGLDYIREDEQIGPPPHRRARPAHRLRELRRSSASATRCCMTPPWGIGDPLVRNRGTLAGSVAHADPAVGLASSLAGAQR